MQHFVLLYVIYVSVDYTLFIPILFYRCVFIDLAAFETYDTNHRWQKAPFQWMTNPSHL